MSRKPIIVSDEFKIERVFNKLLLLDVVRGMDSTGIAKIGEDNSVHIRKHDLPSYHVLDMRSTARFINASRVSGMIGHNRAATKGAVNVENAHPFQHGHITLVHNGTLTSMVGLEGTFDTDSERIALTMSVQGEKETLEKLKGAYALVWYNSEDRSFNFARNSERPLNLWQITEDIMVWASEPWMMVGALSEPFKVEFKPTERITSLEVGKWLKVPVDGKKPVLSQFSIATNTVTTSTGFRGGRTSDSTESVGVGERLGAGSMDAVGVRPGDSVIVKVTKTGGSTSNVNAYYAHLELVSGVELPANVIGICHKVPKQAFDNAIAAGQVYFHATVVNDSHYTSNCIIVENLLPLCGEKKFQKGAYPKRYDGILLAQERWAKVACDLLSSTEATEEGGSTEITFLDPEGNEIPRSKFKEIIKDGCRYCSHPIDPDLDDYEYYDGEVMHDACVEIWENHLESLDSKGGNVK